MYYCAHWRRTFDSINALQAFYRMPKLFTRRNILSCIIFGSDLDPNGLPMKRERERERGKERERERSESGSVFSRADSSAVWSQWTCPTCKQIE